MQHTHATLALQAGVHPRVISDRLGHSTVAMTLDISTPTRSPPCSRTALPHIADLVGGTTAVAGA